MPITIKINNLSLCHKASGGISQATLPDVCLTPPTPAPVAYRNIAFSKDLAKGTATVFADGGNSIAHSPSEFATSIGDEPGTAGGVKSGTFMKEATWLSFSMNVRFEGRGACRHSDKMFHNHANTINAAGLKNPPVGDGDADCNAMWEAVKKATQDVLSQGGDADPIMRNRAITSAYAQVYQEHTNLKWAGMGAFVSKQAGCAMKLAKEMGSSWRSWVPFADVEDKSKILFDGMALGNKGIFKDIYPNFLFYSKYGNDAFQRCADTNGVLQEMKDAFNLFEKGDHDSVEKATMIVARQEQAGVLEDIMKKNPQFTKTLGNTQWWHDNFPRLSGAKSPDVYLSSACEGGPKVVFSGDITNVSDRLAMAQRVSEAFGQLNSEFGGFFSDEMAILRYGTIITTPKVGPVNGSIWPHN